jgi:transposase InsO family protein
VPGKGQYTQIRWRLQWIREHEGGRPVAEVCRRYPIRPKTFYKWWKRYLQSGKDPKSLADRSRRPHRSPRRAGKTLSRRVIRLRKETGYGPARLCFYLPARWKKRSSPNGIYRILKRAGLIGTRPKNKKKFGQKYAALLKTPGEKVQVDVKYLGKGKNFRLYQYTAVDSFSKLQFVSLYPDLSPQTSVDFLRRLVDFFPFRIQTIQTDHGAEFTYAFSPYIQKEHPFEQALKVKGLKQTLIPVATPRYNGTVERAHRTIQEEFYRTIPNATRPTRSQIVNFLHYYNEARPHSALQMKSPLDHLKNFCQNPKLQPDYSVTYVWE